MSRNILFISVNTIKERTGLHNNVDEKLVNPEILTSQDMYMLPCLGTALYNGLQNRIDNNTLTLADEKLLDEYITPALVYYVMSELPIGLSYQFYNKGVVRKTDEKQENPDAQQLIDVANKYLKKAEFYKQRLIDYLKQEASVGNFPEYMNPGSTYDTMIPENEGYTTSIWLGDDDCCIGKSFEERYQGNINRCCGK